MNDCMQDSASFKAQAPIQDCCFTIQAPGNTRHDHELLSACRTQQPSTFQYTRRKIRKKSVQVSSTLQHTTMDGSVHDGFKHIATHDHEWGACKCPDLPNTPSELKERVSVCDKNLAIHHHEWRLHVSSTSQHTIRNENIKYTILRT